MIDHERKFIFVHVPKTGGNSVKKALGMIGHEHKRFSLCVKTNPEYFTFAFTRNPWDRCVSAFTYLEGGGMNKGDRDGYERYIHGLTFREFLFKYKDRPCITQHHFRPQNNILDGDLDFIGKVENMQEDFDTICDKIGITRQTLPRKNTTKHKHYTEFYDDETREIVAKLYAKDIERFGYEFEN